MIHSQNSLGLGEGFSLPAIYQLLGQLPANDRSQAISKLYACGAAGHLLSLFITPLLPWRSSFIYFGSAGLLWVAVFIGYVGVGVKTKRDSENKSNQQMGRSAEGTWNSLLKAWVPVSYFPYYFLGCF